tara:strand:- start:28 stop:201 length:174 start_codon:yes stop_codon:yes gene_type:complete
MKQCINKSLNAAFTKKIWASNVEVSAENTATKTKEINDIRIVVNERKFKILFLLNLN